MIYPRTVTEDDVLREAIDVNAQARAIQMNRDAARRRDAVPDEDVWEAELNVMDDDVAEYQHHDVYYE